MDSENENNSKTTENVELNPTTSAEINHSTKFIKLQNAYSKTLLSISNDINKNNNKNNNKEIISKALDQILQKSVKEFDLIVKTKNLDVLLSNQNIKQNVQENVTENTILLNKLLSLKQENLSLKHELNNKMDQLQLI